MNRFIKYISLILIIFATSCDDSDLYDGLDFMTSDGTKAEKFAGVWYFQANEIIGDINEKTNWEQVTTVNTSENTENVFWFKGKVIYRKSTSAIDTTVSVMIKCQGKDDLTFVSLPNQSEIYGSSDNAEISGTLKKGTFTTKIGNVTDQLVTSINLTNVSNGVIEYTSYRRTGWEDDDK